MNNESSRSKNNFCLLLRGVPGSGKSTIARYFLKNNSQYVTHLDPDLVDRDGREYKHFRPRMNKNAEENVKMYSFLFWKAEKSLREKNSVIWTQPWSRISEIELTVRNFVYYFTKYKECTWTEKIPNLIETLPFKFLVAKIYVPNEVSVVRTEEKYGRKFDLKRLEKTQKLFQDIDENVPNIEIDGENQIEKSLELLEIFIRSYTNK